MDATGSWLTLTGTYRHQSTRLGVPSRLHYRLWQSPRPMLAGAAVDRALSARHDWQGRFHVRLSPLEVGERTGGFASADALYYASRFDAAKGSAEPGANLLDMTKLRAHLRTRCALLDCLLAPAASELLWDELGSDLVAAWEEYLCHEAGHGSGLDVDTKMCTGFFRPDGRLAWPLVFAEEHRADLLSFDFALALLPRSRARAVFAFHLIHRFGLLAQQIQSGPVTALQPLLLLAALRRVGVIEVRDGELWMAMPASGWPDAMSALAARGERELNAPGALAAALGMASYVRSVYGDSSLAAEYAGLLATTRRRLAVGPALRAATPEPAP